MILFEGVWDNNIPNGFWKITYNDNVLKCSFHNGNILNNPFSEKVGFSDNIDYNFLII